MCFRPPSVDEGGEAICASCGEANEPRSNICSSCGKPLLKVPEAASGKSSIPAVPGSVSVPKMPRAPKSSAVPQAPRSPKSGN